MQVAGVVIWIVHVGVAGVCLLRRYNFLLYVPYQLERLIQLGTLLCWDSLIAVVTIMPCRALMALMQLTGLTGLLGWMVGGGAGRQRGKANRLAGYQVRIHSYARLYACSMGMCWPLQCIVSHV